MKVCSRCGIEKPLSEFSPHPTGKFGRQSRCKACRTESERDRRANHRDVVRECNRKYCRTHPDRRKQSFRNWYEEHADFFPKWRAAHRDDTRGYVTKWRRTHPDANQTDKANRRARQRGSEGIHTESEWLELKNEYGQRCAYCGRMTELTRDHIVPLKAGGTNSIDNIVPACKPCNSSKRDTSLLFWLKRLSKQARRV